MRATSVMNGKSGIRDVVIHHISDTHFGKFEMYPVSADKSLSGIAGKTTNRYSDLYMNYLRRCDDTHRPHFLIVSGDLASVGKAEELQAGQAFCSDAAKHLCGPIDTQKSRVIVVPGNHDTLWSGENDIQRTAAFKEIFKDFRTPYSPTGGALPDQAPVFFYPDYNVLVWAIDTAVLSGWRHPDLQLLSEKVRTIYAETSDRESIEKVLQTVALMDPGCVQIAELDKFEDRCRQLRAELKVDLRRTTNIAVLHHPVSLLPGSGPRMFPLTTNGGFVKKILQKYSFDLVLHGHCHSAHTFYEMQEPGHPKNSGQGLHIVGAGPLAGFTNEGSSFNKICVSRDVGSDNTSIQVCRVTYQAQEFSDSENVAEFVRYVDSTDNKLNARYLRAFNDARKSTVPHIRSLSRRLDTILEETRHNGGYTDSWMDRDYQRSLSVASGVYATDVLGSRPLSYPVVYDYLSRQFHRQSVFNCSLPGDSKGCPYKWTLKFSPIVHQAIETSLSNASKALGGKATLFKDEQDVVRTVGHPEFEIARVLLWKREDLLDDNTAQLIRLYDEHRIPLFYFNVEKLRGPKAWRENEYLLFVRMGDNIEDAQGDTVHGLWIGRDDTMECDQPLVNGRLGNNETLGFCIDHFRSLLSSGSILLARHARELISTK